MESAAVRVLALLGLAAVAASVALLCARPLIAALDGALKKWRRMGIVPRVVAVLMAAVATVEAQKSGMGDSNRVERVDCAEGGGSDFSRKEHKESVGVDGEKLKLGVEQRTDKPSSVQLGLETSTHLLVSVKTNDSYSYAMPENAVRYPNWWIRGGYEDVFKLGLGDFRFPLGTNIVDYLWVYTWGKVRPRLKAKELEIAAVGAPMSAVPQVSEFWYMDGTNGSKILTWQNFFLGRVPLSVSSVCSVVPISAQLELFSNGDYIARSNLVERYFKRVNPDDFDDDGIPDGVDENPELSDGDFFGPDNDFPEGANSNNYCWVDVVVSNANSLVTFIGDRPSNLPDPYFIAKPDVTNRVTLLIGKTYRVTSAQPIILTAKSNDDIIIDVHDSRFMTICYPVSYEIVDMARSVSRQIRMIPPSLVGTFNWNTNTCCVQVQTSPSELPKCAWDCACEGCTLGGFTFDYEGYSLNFGGIGCGCSVGEGEGSDDNQDGALVSVSFSHKVLFYEEAYTNAPGDVVARRHSTNVTVRVEAYGGKYGGLLSLTQAGFDKLSFLSGDEIPQGSIMLGEGERRSWEAVYAPHTHSEEKDDIRISARVTEYETGDEQQDEDELTVVKFEIEPWVTKAGCKNRHLVGVRENINCCARPHIGEWRETGDGNLRSELGVDVYECPLIDSVVSLYYLCGNLKHYVNIDIVEPQCIEARCVTACRYPLSIGKSGGVGLKTELYVIPETVSFSGIAMEEIPTNEGVHSGYFANLYFQDVWYHTEEMKAGQWCPIGENFCMTDEACIAGSLPRELPNGKMTTSLTDGAWSEGVLEWDIPWGWGVLSSATGDVPVKRLPMKYNQLFQMTEDGCLTISKFGEVVSRTTNSVIRLNGVIVEGELLPYPNGVLYE